jgi:hypothetical protein
VGRPRTSASPRPSSATASASIDRPQACRPAESQYATAFSVRPASSQWCPSSAG